MCKVVNIGARNIFDQMNQICSDITIPPMQRIKKLTELKRKLNNIGHDVEAVDPKPETPDVYFKLITL